MTDKKTLFEEANSSAKRNLISVGGCPDTLVHVDTFLLGSLLERARHCSQMRFLDGVNSRSLAGFGWESFAWVRYTGFADGGLPMGSTPGTMHW
jgi:hypothetical protein